VTLLHYFDEIEREPVFCSEAGGMLLQWWKFGEWRSVRSWLASKKGIIVKCSCAWNANCEVDRSPRCVVFRVE